MTDEQILDRILAHEGGYVWHTDDKGGPTNRGITQATLSDWLGRPATLADVQGLTEDTARAIYREKYLKPFDGVDPEVKPQVVDIAVNSGVMRARTLLAQAQQQTERPVNTQLAILRLEHYAKIVKQNPKQSVFLLGWIRRAVGYLCTFLAWVLIMGCSPKSHPVQPTPKTWTLPSGLSHCLIRERVKWPDGSMTVTVHCPNTVLLVDYHSKEIVELVTWNELRRR